MKAQLFPSPPLLLETTSQSAHDGMLSLTNCLTLLGELVSNKPAQMLHSAADNPLIVRPADEPLLGIISSRGAAFRSNNSLLITSSGGERLDVWLLPLVIQDHFIFKSLCGINGETPAPATETQGYTTETQLRNNLLTNKAALLWRDPITARSEAPSKVVGLCIYSAGCGVSFTDVDPNWNKTM